MTETAETRVVDCDTCQVRLPITDMRTTGDEAGMIFLCPDCAALFKENPLKNELKHLGRMYRDLRKEPDDEKRLRILNQYKKAAVGGNEKAWLSYVMSYQSAMVEKNKHRTINGLVPLSDRDKVTYLQALAIVAHVDGRTRDARTHELVLRYQKTIMGEMKGPSPGDEEW